MNPNEATHMLTITAGVTTHLHDDFNDFHTKVLHVEQDIQRLKTLYRRMKEIRAAADYKDEDPDHEEVILTTSEALISMGKTIARLEIRMEVLNLCINTSNAAQTSLNKFGNKALAIPKIN